MIILQNLFVLMCLFFMSGCGIYDAVVDERPITTIASDTGIKGKILKKLVESKEISALDMTASCYNGHAYLVGEYEKPEQKSKAIAIAKSVEGVKDVTTYFVEKKDSESCGMTDNAATTLKVKTALVADKEIWSTNIDIKTIQCKTVVLWGLVGRKSEISKAIGHAKKVEGVSKVKSLLKATQI